MADERPDKMTIAQLKKKYKEAEILIIVSLAIFLSCLILLIILIPVWAGVIIPILALTVIGFRERNKMRQELKKREIEVTGS